MADSLTKRWLSGYPNANTRRLYGSRLRTLTDHAGIAALELASEAQVIAWIADGGSNNNVRDRISVALTPNTRHRREGPL